VAYCFVTHSLPGTALERLSARHTVEVWPEATPISHDNLLDRAEGAEGLISTVNDSLDRTVFDRCKQLRAVANYAVGADNIDIDAATHRGIPVGNTPDVLTETTADIALALMLTCARRLPEARDCVLNGEWRNWDPGGLLGYDLYGAKLGIIGFGRIGQAIARRALGFSMQILWNTQSKGSLLDQILTQSDFVVVACPLTEATYRLIDERALSMMKPTSILVNIARGPIVDMQALRRALDRGQISGAGLDVTDPEPLSPDDPLLKSPRVCVLPHIGSATHATRERMADMCVDNLLSALDGKPMPYTVNPQASRA
jgi:glyoxylate reductase